MVLHFFFEHMTAYEMRISDLSSDVCSSDLRPGEDQVHEPRVVRHSGSQREVGVGVFNARRDVVIGAEDRAIDIAREIKDPELRTVAQPLGVVQRARIADLIAIRSAEHTSELQSLLRISYAVFCSKKTNHQIK